MNGRERHQAVFAGEVVDRLPLCHLVAWGETKERWRGEGLGADEDPGEAIGLVKDEGARVPLNLNMHPLFEIEVIARSERYVTLVDEFGVTKKMLRSDFERSGGLKSAAVDTSSMSQWLDHPVCNMASWKALHEERFRPTREGRVPDNWDEEKGRFGDVADTRWVQHFSFPFGGLFSAVRELMGLEGAIFAMADDPGLVHTIVADLSRFYLEAFALVIPEIRLDQVTCFEDMCSKTAPLISPATFREFFRPAYESYIGGLKEMGVEQVFIDTDGDARLIIPELMECGFTGVSPCEIKAGMDPGALRDAHPALCCAGGIDKVAVANGGDVLEREFERRFRTAWDRGRYTPSLDHSAPPDISWDNMQHFARLFHVWHRSSGGPG